MRQLSCFLAILVLGSLAGAQTTVISGYATNSPPIYGFYPPGSYAVGFVPLVTTPTVSLSNPPLQVGATNATAGNVAGATSATVIESQPIILNAPIQYAPSSAEAQAATNQATSQYDDLGAAVSQSSIGEAQLAPGGRGRQVARPITNDDVERLNQQTGTVQFGGKTEKIE